MIVVATLQHLPDLSNLWADYQTFYQVKNINTQRNQNFIKHILAHPEEGLIHVYLLKNKPVAFSTLYFTYSSTVSTKVGVLNDLYVDPDHRRKGIAQALVDNAREVVKNLDISIMRWMTQETNTTAQKLYEQYAKPSKWLSYSLKV